MERDDRILNLARTIEAEGYGFNLALAVASTAVTVDELRVEFEKLRAHPLIAAALRRAG